MPRIAYNQTNFTAGEISPRLRGRGDVDRYANAVKLMENAFPTIYGGAQRHFGSVFQAEVKDSTKRVRLIPFIFSRDQAYILEMGDGYIRFFTPSGQLMSGGTPYQIASPYQQSDLFDVEYTQGADSMFLTHGDVTPQRLQRLGSPLWQMSNVPIDVLPFKEWGTRPNATLSLSGTTGTITATTSTNVFLPSDVGRTIEAGSGIAAITTYVSPTQVTAAVQAQFNLAAYDPNAWKIGASPQVAVAPTQNKPVGLVVQLVAAGNAVIVSSYSWASGVLTLNTSGPHGLNVGDRTVLVGFESVGLNGTYSVTATPSGSSFTIGYASQVQQGGGLGVIYKYGAGQAWRATDVGSFVEINGGLVRITSVQDATTCTGTIVKEMTSTIAAPPNGWFLKAPVWNEIDGYPAAVALHQQRLVYAGSPGYPRTIWGSKTGEYYDFTLGTADGDAYSYEMASSDSVDQIAHIYSTRRLIILTYGGEFIGSGGSAGAITPTNIQIDPQTAYGSSNVKPVRVGAELLFVQRSGRRVRALGYNFDSDSYVADDLTRLAEHITEGGIVDMAYQQEPYTIVWAVRADGVLLSLTYDRGQNVIGWARRPTNGAFESVACIPAGDRDQVWVVVRRTVGGVTKRYVERLDDTMTVDCGVVGTSDVGSSVWSGL